VKPQNQKIRPNLPINGDWFSWVFFLQFKQVIRQFDLVKNKKFNKIKLKTVTNSTFGI
jgi:hypothetical protein